MTALAAISYWAMAEGHDDAARARNSVDPEILARDRAWAERIKAGDAVALEQLFTAYFAAFAAYAYRYVPARDVAKDVVQDVLGKLWINRDRWTIPDNMAAMLYRAVRNRALQVHRHELVISQHESDVQAQGAPLALDAAATTTEHELRQLGERAIAALPPRCREIFLMSRVDRLTYREIAATLGISMATVETQMARAFRALDAALSDFRR